MISFLSIDKAVPAGTSARFTAKLKDEAGALLPGATLSVLTLTLLDPGKRAIVNEVDAVDVLNTGRGTIDVNGLLTITLLPADTALLDEDRAEEERVMVLRWEYSGTKKGAAEIRFSIAALLTAIPVTP